MNQVKNQVEETIQWLFANDAKEMKKICNKEMMRFGGISEMDYDDFYSQVDWDISKAKKRFEKNYDSSKEKTFKDYIYGVIKFAVWKQMTKKNRRKRQIIIKREVVDNNGNIISEKEYIPTVSLNAPIKEESNMMIGDTLQSDFDIDAALSETIEYGYSDKVEMFLDNLSETPQKIAKMIMCGYSAKDIKENLGLTDKEYQDCWKMISSYENKRILYEGNNNVEDDEMNTTISTEDVAESYKNTSYSIDSISKQLQKKRIRDDHILQRHSGQWKRFAKSELVSDVLRGKSLTQIIISEEIKGGLRMQWLIDGKQRCTTLDDFLHDGFAISRNVKNYNIRYQTTKLDESGYEVLNEDGFTEMEFKEFDIRGKKFSQLPEELQEIFKDRQIPVLYNMNCNKKDIADDIARFNRSRPMNVAQNGWLGLEESFAELVGNISKMQFFQKDYKGTSYTLANHTSGAIRRIIVEAIMVSDFIEDFKDFDKMCEFLSAEASDSNFTEFYFLVERLTVICNESVAKMFNTTDSFLWLGLFSKFAELGIDDKKFIDFMVEFETSMKDIKVDVSYDGIDRNSFNELCMNPQTRKCRGTKDRNMVIAKMLLLEKLMLDYLHINKEDRGTEMVGQSVDNELRDVVSEFLNTDIDKEDIEIYEAIANDTSEVIEDIDFWVISDENRPAFLALISCAMKDDVDDMLKDWLVDYSERNQYCISDVKANFSHMKNDFKKFVENVNEVST